MAVVTYLVAELMKRMDEEEKLELLGYLSWEDIQGWRKVLDRANDTELMDQATTLGRQQYQLGVAHSEVTGTSAVPAKPHPVRPSLKAFSGANAASAEVDWETELEELRRALRGPRGKA